MRYFNTAGPCEPGVHYMLPAAERLAGAHPQLERGMYFVLHAPRQTGKTTSLRAIARALTEEGRFVALHVSCEAGEAAGDDYEAAQQAVLATLSLAASLHLPPELRPPVPWPASAPPALLLQSLSAWAQSCPRPIVLLLDEIDALRGESLRSVLRQLRAGYPDRPAAFPHAVVLCGLRDVRDYRLAAGADPDRLGTSSPFNIKVSSVRLSDFSLEEVRSLYAQHAADTGQSFTDEAVELAFSLTEGQPWLVNALAHEVVEGIRVPADEPITAAHVDQAKERLILARATHLDSLVARLHEDRVRRVVQPVIAGDLLAVDSYDDDVSYVRDLGLVALDNPVRIANPIYREIVVRVLAASVEGNVQTDPRGYVGADGRLEMRRLLAGFTAFWREHGEILAGSMVYHEVAPQLVLMAWLQRVVNGGGFIDREYGVARGRIDLLLRWPYVDPGRARAWQREAIELKVWAPGRPDPLAKGLAQLDEYLDKLGLEAGTLVVFDRRPTAGPIEERTRIEDVESAKGRRVTLVRV